MPRMSLEEIDDEELYHEELKQAQEAGNVSSILFKDYLSLLKASCKPYYIQKLSLFRKAQRERKRVRRQRRARQRKHNQGRL